MRSLAGSPVRRSGAGVALFVALITAGPTGCEWIKGRPDVGSVEVSVSPTVIAEGQSATANAVPKRGDGTVISSSRVKVSFSSSDASIASVNASSGVVTGVAPGKAEIIASAQGKDGRTPIEVVPADPVTIVANPPSQLSLNIGQSGTITLDPKNGAGLTLPGRTASFASNDTRVATVTPTGPLTARVSAVSLGAANITATIGSKSVVIQVLVRLTPPATAGLALATGKSEIRVKEAQQVVVTLRDSAGNVLSPSGRTIVYNSSDVTVASVNSQTGVVTGVKEGAVEITVNVDNLASGRFALRVLPQRAEDLKFPVPSYIFRRGGRTLDFAATAVDSARIRVDRPISYRSLNDAVVAVNNIGLVTPRAIGATKIIASIDNLTDTLSVQVTEVPITSVRVTPTQATAAVGETRQFTATLFDSLGAQVTGREITWQTNNPPVATVSGTGLATARAPGLAQVQAFTDVVPGFATRVGQAAELIVAQTPVARITVTPDSVGVRAGSRTTVVIRAFDAAGNELFNRANSIVVRTANPGVATGDPAGNVVGVAEGKTTITYQAVDAATGLAQGTPATLVVSVTSGGGGDDDD